MADGTYERRGPREAELQRLRRLLAEQAQRRAATATAGGDGPVAGKERVS